VPPVHIDPPPTVGESAAPQALGAARAIDYLRVSVTDRCNLRCRYCMPLDQEFFERDRLLTYEEIADVARVLVDHGVRKIRLTGGEPLLRRDIPRLVSLLSAIPGSPEVVMTTNGMLLGRHAAALRAAGLQRLNVSLDSLRPERFETIAHRRGLPEVLAGLEAARQAGFEGTKLNMVVLGGLNDDEIPAMLEFSASRQLELRLIESMPLTSNGYGRRFDRVPLGEIRSRVEQHVTLVPRARGSGPAQTFTVAETGQRIGIIAAISMPFCETCNRVRLTAEGVLRSCLFEGGEVSIRELVRSGQGVERGLRDALEYLRRVKPPVHEGLGHVQMNQVGG
jgi:cyclic pyranopterin phosphate synthase